MKAYYSKIKDNIKSQKGMTLVEVLVAMAVLMVVIMTFTPLFAHYYKNIRDAGVLTRTTYHKVSLMERLLADKESVNKDYETNKVNIPLKLTVCSANGTDQGVSLSFGNSSADFNKISGKMITTDGEREDKTRSGSKNNYATFYIGNASARMVCFPKSLTDDFVETNIQVFPLGFEFKDKSKFVLEYTDSTGALKTVPKKYYDVELVTEDGYTYAEFTFYGANDYICFQNSPLVISYGSREVDVEIGAPMMIMVGEATQNEHNGTNYHYYATAGVDTKTGHMDLLGKNMALSSTASSGSTTTTSNIPKPTAAANLNAAMNDVEWVEPGEGYDINASGKKVVNRYGYYIMGGDNGQVRRFWRNSTTGNYFWGGDYLVDFKMYSQEGSVKAYSETEALPQADRVNSTYSSTFKNTLTTQASYESYYQASYSGNNMIQLTNYNGKVLGFGSSDWWNIYFCDFGTVTAKSTGGVDPDFYVAGNYRGVHDTPGWLTNKKRSHQYDLAYGTKMKFYTNYTISSDKYNISGGTARTPLESYRAMTGDDTPMPITITSVASISLNASDKSQYLSSTPHVGVANDGYHGEVSGVEAYPQTSYSLYCGTIPAFADVFGKHINKSTKGYMAGLGIGAVVDGNKISYGLTGIFADQDTPDIVFRNADDDDRTYTAKGLLYWLNDPTGYDVNDYKRNIAAGSLLSNYYHVGEGKNVDGTYKAGVTANKKVNITIGYLSQPYANSNSKLMGHPNENTVDYLTVYSGMNAVNHNFYGLAPREFSTFLDIDSYHDDAKDATFSVAAGYALGVFTVDANGFARIGQLYNTGIVYVRAADSDDTPENQLDGGSGWSMQKETNVFHHLYGIDMHVNGKNKTGVRGWNNEMHLQTINLNVDGGSTGGGNIPSRITYNNAHPMEQTECRTVACGMDRIGYPEFMVGTSDGTVISWSCDYENPDVSNDYKNIWNGALKEFESYHWFVDYYLHKGLSLSNITDLASKGAYKEGGFADYWSANSYGGVLSTIKPESFISTLTCINDIKYADDLWVAVGNQGDKTPIETGSGTSTYNGLNGAKHGSFINVRQNATINNKEVYAWKSVMVAEPMGNAITGYTYINFVSVEYCQGVWYAMGYIDADGDDHCDEDEEGVIYYATNPLEEAYDDDGSSGSYNINTYNGGWRRCLTRTDANTYTAQTTVLFHKSGDTFEDDILTGVNSMASQG